MSHTNQRFVQDLNRMVKGSQSTPNQPKTVQVDPIIAKRGVGEKVANPNPSSGIASPLKEIAHLREYDEPELLTSSDGLFVMERKRVRKMVFEDASSSQLIVYF